MTGLFPAELNIVFSHGGGNVGIAYWGNFSLDVVIFGPVEESLICHNCNCDFFEIKKMSDDSDDLIAVDDIPLLINHETTVAITIVGDAKI